MMYVVNNSESVHTNSSVHTMNTRNKTHLYRPVANLTCFQTRVSYSCQNIFNSLPTNILELKNDKLHFKAVLWKYLIIHSFYSVISYTQSRCLTQLIFITLNTFYGNSVHFKYYDKAIILLILLFIYSILYLFYIIFI